MLKQYIFFEKEKKKAIVSSVAPSIFLIKKR